MIFIFDSLLNWTISYRKGFVLVESNPSLYSRLLLAVQGSPDINIQAIFFFARRTSYHITVVSTMMRSPGSSIDVVLAYQSTVLGLIHSRGETLSAGPIAYSFSLSLSHCPDMTGKSENPKSSI